MLCHPVVAAAVRVLGAWLAEESLALSEQVYQLLPFLLQLCAGSPEPGLLQTQGHQVSHVVSEAVVDGSGATSAGPPPNELLKFLLPGLCHLTVEEKPRRVLLKAQVEGTLLEYMRELALQGPLSEYVHELPVQPAA